MKFWHLVTLVGILWFSLINVSEANGIWFTAESVQNLDTATKEKTIRQAEKTLAEDCPLLTDKEIAPPSGDKRDYTSLAVYFWPNDTTSDGLPYVRRDGKVNPEKWDETRYDAKRLLKMKNQVKVLAQGYALIGRNDFAERAVKIIDKWFINEGTRMNPRLEYAQLIPGKRQGGYSGIIDTINLIEVVDSLYLLENAPSYDAKRQQAVKKWFSDYSEWLQTSDMGQAEAKSKNNHGVWYDAQLAVFAHFAGRDEVARKLVKTTIPKRLAGQMAADGSLPLELARTRPLHYSTFALRAYLTLARVGDLLGENIYDEPTNNGGTIKQALAFIVPYAKGEKSLPKNDVTKWNAAPFWQALAIANKHYNEATWQR